MCKQFVRLKLEQGREVSYITHYIECVCNRVLLGGYPSRQPARPGERVAALGSLNSHIQGPSLSEGSRGATLDGVTQSCVCYVDA